MSSEVIYAEERSDFYVYVYRDPFTMAPFYIGKGLNGRADQHLMEAKDERNTPENYYNSFKLRKIRKILDQGKDPIIERVCEGMTEDDAFELEVFLISEIGRRVLDEGPLTNLTDGGEGFSGVIRDKNKYHIINIDTGEEKNLTQFQMHRELGMTQVGACCLVSGKTQISIGWRLFENETERTVYVGQKHTFTNAYTNETVHCTQNELVVKYNLNAACVHAIVAGKRKQTEGWCLNEICDDYEFEDRNTYKFVHYSGDVVYLTIKDFKEQIYDSSKVVQMIKGRKQSVNGWSLNTPPTMHRVGGHDPRIFKFYNIKTKEERIYTRLEFMKEFSENTKTLDRMINRKATTRKGWRIIFDADDYNIDADKGKRKDKNVYQFFNKKTEEIFTGTRHELLAHVGTTSMKFDRMFIGQSSKGWTIIK